MTRLQRRVQSLGLAIVVFVAAPASLRTTPSSVSRATLEVHRSALVVDLHCDTILDIQAGKRTLAQRSTEGHVDLPRLREGGVGAQVFAMFVAPRMTRRGQARVRELIQTFPGTVKASASEIAPVTTVDPIEQARREGKVAAILSIENGGDAVGGDPRGLDNLYREGVRMIGLTWNLSNPLGDGAPGRTHGGLTDAGRATLRRMEEMGIVVDVSHLSEASFWDAMKVTRGPIIASHSNASGLHPHPRTLTDDQLRVIAQRGGVVGVNFYAGFLGAASLEHVLAHIDYLVKVMGVDHVALGSDFDGIPQAPRGLEDVSKMPNLTAGLQRRGYTTEQIQKILGGNAIRVLREVWKK